MSSDEGDSKEPQRSRRFLSQNPPSFNALFILANILGLTSIVLVLSWCNMLGGFSWRNPSTRFNWHPLMMVLGFVFFYGNGSMIYRLLRNESKPFLKWIHAGLNATALVCALIGQIAVFSFHNEANIPNLYSLHSWIGGLTVTLYAANLIGGSIAFLYPKTPPALRSMILPFHVFGGVSILALIVVSCVSGITEKAIFSLGKEYSRLPSQGMVLNFLGLFIVFFALIVGFLITRAEFKRKPLPAETVHQVPMEETSH
jgi:hypothetical protein